LTEGWQYLSIPVFPYVGVAEYLGINTAVLQFCSIASVGAKNQVKQKKFPEYEILKSEFLEK
jgi:hypothetical protein